MLKNISFITQKLSEGLMLHIILLILKIIGIIVLFIIALLLLLLCIILFVPIRYRIQSDNKDGIQANASVTWLLHFIHFHLKYVDNFSYYLTIFGIKVYPKGPLKPNKHRHIFPLTNQANKKMKHKNKSLNKSEAIVNNQKPEIQLDSRIEESNTRHIKPNLKQTKINGRKRTKKKKKNTFTFRSLYDKIKENIKLFKKNINRIYNKSTKRAFHLCKKELFHLLKLIFPRRIKGILELGMKDPSQTGELYGLYSIFYPVHHGKIVMIPYFEKEIYTYTITAIGHIRIITLLIIAIKVYFNKDIQRLIQIFKKEED